MPEHKKEDIVKFVTNRQTALEKDKQLWEGLLQDVADYVNPVREDIKGNIQFLWRRLVGQSGWDKI